MVIFKREQKQTSSEKTMYQPGYPSNAVHQGFPYANVPLQQPVEAARFPRFCIECGSRIETSASFCACCGRQIVTGMAGV